MTAWPEILFVDGTYKLLNSELVVMLIAVHDSDGCTEIVSVGLLGKEDSKTMNWFFESFKSENLEACKKIECIMSDKDQTMRTVMREVFENIPLYLCLFHTQQTFQREITSGKRGITAITVKSCLSHLQQMAHSHSIEKYNELYEELTNFAPQSVKNYFDENWHTCRNEWTVYSMVQGNLGNNTNNRLESLNAQIKALIPKRRSLPKFIELFFQLIKSRENRIAIRVAKNFTNKSTLKMFTEGSIEQLYCELLLEKASDLVLKEIKEHWNLVVVKNDQLTCTFSDKEVATVSSCNCRMSTSWKLPCKHIFKTRSHFKISLYCKELCAERWMKTYYIKNQRSFRIKELDKTSNGSVTVTQINSDTLEPITKKDKRQIINGITKILITICSKNCYERFDEKIKKINQLIVLWTSGDDADVQQCTRQNGTHISRRDTLPKSVSVQTVPEKRKLLRPLMRELENTAVTFTGHKFRSKVETLESIEKFWRQDNDISLTKYIKSPERTPVSGTHGNLNLCFSDLDEKVRNLDCSGEKNRVSVNDNLDESVKLNNKIIVDMPSPIITRGRPKQAEITWVNISGKKRNKINKKNNFEFEKDE